jgi:uncharacterized protein YprB with RNaseH-like and TPR domain
MLEAYLDIETTGLTPDNCQITVVGIYIVGGEKSEIIQLIGDDITAERLMSSLHGVRTLHTYNGSRFDLPFIDARHRVDLSREFEHIDLMFHCWQRNLYGGLKSVERQLGINRNLTGVNGLEAIRLWWAYINDNDDNALKTLLEYNKEDVVNLKSLKEKLQGRPKNPASPG